MLVLLADGAWAGILAAAVIAALVGGFFLARWYFKRQLEGEEGLHRINTLNKIKDDLIALFEAYQHN